MAGTPANINQIRTKADLVKYAVEFTAKVKTNSDYTETKIPDYEKAQGLIDFFNKNVSLPDTDTSMSELMGIVKAAAEAVAASKEPKPAETQE